MSNKYPPGVGRVGMLTHSYQSSEGYQPEEFNAKFGLEAKGERESKIQIVNVTYGKGALVKLSPMDMPQVFSWTPFLFPFENIDGENEFMSDDTLVKSLQQAVERVPVITGHLERIDGTPVEMTGPNSDMHVVVGTSGVWYTSSQIPGSFQEFKESGFSYEVLHPSFIFRRSNEAIKEGKNYSLFTVKVNRFACGSVVMLVSACHLIADARSVYEFVKSWSTLCRDKYSEDLAVESRHLYSYDDHLTEGSRTMMEMFMSMKRTASRPHQRTKLVQFTLSTDSMATLKANINKELAPEWVSTDDILCILAYRALLRARQVPSDAPSKLVRIVDARKLNTPPLSMHAFGNGVSIYITGPQPASNMISSSLAVLTRRIRQGIYSVTAQIIRDSTTAIAHLPFKDHPLGGNTIPFSDDAFTSSYAGFKPACIDFGKSPCLTVTRGVFTEGLIIPHPIHNGTISVKVGVNSLHVPAFLADPELLGLGFKIIS